MQDEGTVGQFIAVEGPAVFDAVFCERRTGEQRSEEQSRGESTNMTDMPYGVLAGRELAVLCCLGLAFD